MAKGKNDFWKGVLVFFIGAIVILIITGLIGSGVPAFKAWNDKILHAVVEVGCIFGLVWGIPYIWKSSKEMYNYVFKDGPEPK